MFRKELILTDEYTNGAPRLSLSGLSQIFEGAASEHLFVMGKDYKEMREGGLMWIIVNRHTSIERMPRVGEKISIETWPGSRKHGLYPRRTVIRDDDGNVLIRDAAYWAVVSLESREMITSEEKIIIPSEKLPEGEMRLPGWVIRIPEVQQVNYRTVQRSETDGNGHMNNSNYLKWAEDAYGQLGARFKPSGFHIIYTKELLEGDEAELRMCLRDGIFSMEGLIGTESCFKAEIVF